MSQTLDLIIAARNQTDAAFKQMQDGLGSVEKQLKSIVPSTEAWSAAQQRSAMRMAGLHDEAKKFNQAVDAQRASQEKLAASFRGSELSAGALGSALGIATNPVVLLGGVVTGLAAGFAVATSKVLETAGAMSDLSSSTGINVEALQTLKHAGELVGVSVDDIAGAVTQMNKRLVESPQAFEKLGLSASALKNMGADEALAAIAEKIASIQNPAEQTSAAMQLLGRSGATLLPLLKSDLAGAADEAERLGFVLSEKTVAAVDALGDQLTTLGAAWEALQTQTAAAWASSETLADALGLVTLAVGTLAKTSDDGREARTALIDDLLQLTQLGKIIAIGSAVTSTGPTVRNRPNLGGPAEIDFAAILGAGLRETDQFLKETEKAHKAAEGAARKHADAIKSIEKAYRDAANEFARLQSMAGSAAFPGTGPLDAERRTQADGMLDAIGRQNAIDRGVTYENVLKAQMAAAERNQAAQIEMWLGIADSAGQVLDIIDQLGGLFDELGVSADSDLRRVAESIGEVVGGVQQGAKAFAQFSSGDILGGISSAIGSVTSLVSGFRGLFGGGGGPSPAEILAHDLMVMRTEFINASGGLDALEAAAADAGVSLEAMWNARTVAEYEAAVKRVQDAIELHESAVDKTVAAMERWGLTAADMGPAFAQGMLHESLAEIFQDLKLLEAGGADVAKLLAGPMGDSIQTYVQQAMASGAALPEFMRPFIQSLIDSKDLVDENGEAITDVSQLQFTESLEAGVGRLIEQIEKLVSALLGIPPEVETLVKVHTQHTGSGSGGSGDDGSWPGPPDVTAAHGYHGWITGPTTFLAGERGPERVDITPANQTPASGSTNINVSLSVDASSVPAAHRQQFLDSVADAVGRTFQPGGRNYRNFLRAQRAAAAGRG